MIGAIVLVALAVIFLPMLIKGPAPESGVADIPLDAPEAPQGGFETRELPLIAPTGTPEGGVVGLESGASDEGRLPTVDTRDAAAVADEGLMAAATAGGDYAVNFGTYSSSADAERVVAALRGARLPGYQETASGRDGRTLYRVRIGPFATQADAEAARVHATGVHSRVDARVVALNADAASPAPASTTSTPMASEAEPKTEAPRETRAKPAPSPEAVKPQAPVAAAPKPAAPAAPAAASVGFAVQLGAFSHADEAARLRDRARAAGFSAFIEQVNTDKGVLSRVRVGPVASRGEAEELKARLAAQLGIAGIVRPHP